MEVLNPRRPKEVPTENPKELRLFIHSFRGWIPSSRLLCISSSLKRSLSPHRCWFPSYCTAETGPGSRTLAVCHRTLKKPCSPGCTLLMCLSQSELLVFLRCLLYKQPQLICHRVSVDEPLHLFFLLWVQKMVLPLHCVTVRLV